MKKTLILSTVILSLLSSSIVSANNVKQNNNNIKNHQQIEKSIKQKQVEEASKQKQAEEASKQKQAEEANKQKQAEINKSSLNENKIAAILNSNQLYKLSNYTTLYGKYGDTIIVFNNKSELNKFNKVVNKTEDEDCPLSSQFNYLVNYLNNHHCMAKFFNSQNQNIIINTYHNYNTDRVIIHEFKDKL